MAIGAPSPARLEAFSDGVIAVIITIMVLELKVPHAEGMAGLLALAPGLAIYLLSFSFTGIYWLNHQHLIRRIEKAGHSIQCSNLGFLFCLSLLPLSTAYVVEKQLSGFAVAVYAFSLLIVALAFFWLRISVHRHMKHRDAITNEDRIGMRNHLLSIVSYGLSIALAFHFPHAVLVFIALLTFVWALPNLSWHQAKQHCE